MPKRLVALLVVSSLCILALLVALVYAVALSFKSVLAATTIAPLSFRIAASVALVVGAIVLYAVKKSRYQFVYGLLEVAVGLVSNWRSLEGWPHPLAGPGPANSVFGQLAVLGAGVYLIGRGLSNVFDGFHRLLPVTWSMAKTWFKEGYDQPTNIPVPKRLLKYHIAGIKAALDDPTLTPSRIDELRDELRVATARYDKEVLGH